jgi:hypothetical protein
MIAIGGGARGSGTATAQRAGTGATIRIEGTTHDGVRIVAVFRCATGEV